MGRGMLEVAIEGIVGRGLEPSVSTEVGKEETGSLLVDFDW
jgi:hypothetical protein